jgi:hypothetical protein
VGKIVFPRTLISFSKGLDSVAKRSMLAFHQVALGIVRWGRRLPNAKRGNNFRDKVTQELGTSVTVYLVTDSKARKDFCDQFVNYYLRVSSAAREGFQPSSEAVRDCLHVLVAFLGPRQRPNEVYADLLERVASYMTH